MLQGSIARFTSVAFCLLIGCCLGLDLHQKAEAQESIKIEIDRSSWREVPNTETLVGLAEVDSDYLVVGVLDPIGGGSVVEVDCELSRFRSRGVGAPEISGNNTRMRYSVSPSDWLDPSSYHLQIIEFVCSEFASVARESSPDELVYVQGGDSTSPRWREQARIIAEFMTQEYGISDNPISPNDIRVATFDLNGDGQEEIFGLVQDSRYCGASACQFLVLEQEGGNWISRLSLIGGVEPASTSTNGYRDLEAASWGERFKAIRTFNGLTYDLSYFLDGSYRISPLGFQPSTVRSTTPVYDQPLVETAMDRQLEAGQPVFVRGQIDQWYMVTLTRIADQPFYLPRQVVQISQ